MGLTERSNGRHGIRLLPPRRPAAQGHPPTRSYCAPPGTGAVQGTVRRPPCPVRRGMRSPPQQGRGGDPPGEAPASQPEEGVVVGTHDPEPWEMRPWRTSPRERDDGTRRRELTAGHFAGRRGSDLLPSPPGTVGGAMTACPGSFARSYGRCPYCGAVFVPSPVPGLCITVPRHEPRERAARRTALEKR